MIPIYSPNTEQFSESAINAIRTGWISNHGEYVVKANDKLKHFLNVKHSILMANGTCATHCLSISLKFKYPTLKKIYVSNNCYVAAWNSLLMEYPSHMIEVMKMDSNTWNINTDEEYIHTLDQNAAVFIVHNLGNIINVPRLKRIRPDLIFVEDNCEGFTGKYEGVYSGTSSSSLCASVSFYGNKIITTGEGGAFFTNDTELFNYISKVYSQGMSEERYIHDTFAYNYRMTNIQAAFLYDQLNNISGILENKKIIFDMYESLLQPLVNCGTVSLFRKEEETERSYWMFALRIINNTCNIKETSDFFRQYDVDIRPFFYPINSHKHLKDIPFDDDVATMLNNDIIMIPSSPGITIGEQEKIVYVINMFITFMKKNVEIIEISKKNNNVHYLEDFISNKLPDTFRYFNSRTVEVIENHVITVVMKDKETDRIFGYAHIDNDTAENKSWFGICLLPEYIGKGYGRMLMEYVFAKKYDNIHQIFLSVDNSNLFAIKLYQKMGFIEIGDNPKYKTMIKPC